jgi:hypothetical protein
MTGFFAGKNAGISLFARKKDPGGIRTPGQYRSTYTGNKRLFFQVSDRAKKQKIAGLFRRSSR